MKNKSLHGLGLITLAAALLICPRVTYAQTTNPTGPAGFFNGNSDVGASYDPFTANATRTIPDITVSGTVGSYPLQWSRTMNSCAPGGSSFLFGSGGGWSHSYAWSITPSEDFQVAAGGVPSYYTVSFPDGRVIRFTNSTTISDTCFRGQVGVHERFQQLNTTTLLAYLILPDGGKVEFVADPQKAYDPGPHPSGLHGTLIRLRPLSIPTDCELS